MASELPSRERVEEEKDWDENVDAEQRIREVVLTQDRSRGLDAGEVAERADCSPSTARKYLRRMSGEQVVEVEEDASKKYYPNPEFLRWKKTFRLAEENTVGELEDEMEKTLEEIEELKDEYGVSSPDELRVSDSETHDEVHEVIDDKAYWRSCLRHLDVLKDAMEMSERLETDHGRAHV